MKAPCGYKHPMKAYAEERTRLHATSKRTDRIWGWLNSVAALDLEIHTKITVKLSTTSDHHMRRTTY
jgi:hypothetical protein